MILRYAQTHRGWERIKAVCTNLESVLARQQNRPMPNEAHPSDRCYDMNWNKRYHSSYPIQINKCMRRKSVRVRESEKNIYRRKRFQNYQCILKCSRSSIKYFFFRCSLSFAISRYLNLFLSLFLFYFIFCCCHLPHIVLFSGAAVFCSTVVNSYFLMLPLHVFTVCMSPREFYFALLLFCCCWRCCHFTPFRWMEMTGKKAFTRTWFKCSVSLSVCE